jgi:hypothetical protein
MMAALLLCSSATCSAQSSCARESLKQNLAARPDPVSTLAKKVPNAIRNKDTNSLSTFVGPKGISLGIDSDPMNASRFKKDLLQKGSAYWVIFGPCGILNGSPGDSSLRALLIQQPATIQAQGVDDFPDTRDVAVKGANNPNEDLFTLTFQYVGAAWRLIHIDYL